LLREYRRDIRQFLSGERDEFPEAPRGCFGAEVTARLAEFEEHARRKRHVDVFEKFPMSACLADLRHAWRDLAMGLYANWLTHVAERKARFGQCWPSPASHRAIRRTGSEYEALL
jgi:homoserine O-succinyltransferase/O-acetyltransferase